MKWTIRLAVLLCCTTTAAAQNIGEVTPVDLTGGEAALSLDFSDRDYELILYSTITGAADTTLNYSYTVSGAAVSAKPLVLRRPGPAKATDRDRLEAVLREQERELAARLRRLGGWRPPLHKAVQPAQTSRTFTFGAFGGVTSDRTVQATLVASNSRALGYVDNALPNSSDNVSTAAIQAMLEKFSSTTYRVTTEVFGDPSDVDADGRVIFLFTHLVDQVEGIAGFYSAASLFSSQQGGNGNLADMMFISPTQSLSSYESLLAHEFQHLINYNQHVLEHNGASEESWLNEALSHITEDLVDGHVAGGNPELIAQFMNAPGSYALTGDALLNKGIRGAAYLFTRGLMEEFGDDIPGRLVKTGQAGIPNVEAVTGQTFQDLYQTFAARNFLSGTGLSGQAAFNYTFRFLTEPTTGQRTVSPPREAALSAGGPPVTGSVRPAASAFLRLMGDGAGQTVTLQTEANGAFRALLIPLSKGFQPRLALPADYFPGITLDAPFQGHYTAGEAFTVAGAVVSDQVTKLLLRFASQGTPADTLQFTAEVTGGRFRRPIVFAPADTGAYLFDLFEFTTGPLFDGILSTSFGPVIVSKTDAETFSLPADFFAGITLDAPLPGIYPPGEGIRIAGTVSDPSVSQVSIKFESLSSANEDVSFFFDITGGQFGSSIVFDPSQAGDYRLIFFMGQKGGLLSSVDSFSPVTVTEGSGTVNLPVDFFSGIALDAPMPTQYTAGAGASLTGRVSDATIEVVLLVFTPEAGGIGIRVQAGVSGGVFRKGFVFTPEQAGSYALDIFGGPSGGGLSHRGSFSPVNVTATGSEQVVLPVDIFDGVLLDAPLTTTYFSGKDLQVSGTVSDPSIDQVLFRFDPHSGSGESIRFDINVNNRRFDGTIRFDASQTGDYDLVLFAGSGTLSSVGSFSPVQVLPSQPDISLPRTTLAWGELPVGASQDLSLTVRNQGSATLSVSGISSNGDAFSAAPESFTLSAGDSAVVTVTFAPTAVGQALDTLRISSDDPDLATVRIALSGTATAARAPELTLRLATLDFGTVKVGATAEQRFAIVNTGTDTLNVTTVSGAATPFGTVLPTVIPIFRILPADSVEVRVSFSPQSAGDFSGTLSIAGNIPTTRIALLGSAISSEAPVPPSPDFDGDGVVGFPDFVEFAQVFGARQGTPIYDAKFDLDSDGQIGFSDFAIFAGSFGKTI